MDSPHSSSVGGCRAIHRWKMMMRDLIGGKESIRL